MKIGVFDSGLGGLVIFKEIIKKFPLYDFVYLGDAKHLPYGSRSSDVIFGFTKRAIEFLFDEKNCELVIVACNTASVHALRRIQREILPLKYSDRRVLGVIIPTVEEVVSLGVKKVGILATEATIRSSVYKMEIEKLDKDIKVYEKSAPSLVTLIENNEIKYIEPLLKSYLKPFMAKQIDALVLGCTHYPIIKGLIKKLIGKKIKVISQEEIIPNKLRDYLRRHSEIETKISKNKNREFLVTEITEGFKIIAKRWLGKSVNLELINL